MNRYSQGSNDYRRGGYNSGYRSVGYGKINEEDVPESQHAIFIRGLPSSISTDEIKDFFEDNVGPCSFDFQKVNYERQSIFVAVRFESKDDAKKAYNRYRYEDILGCRCDVTWFRDVRRYIAHQQATGGVIRRGSFGRGGVGRYNDNHSRHEYRKRRHSDDRRSRSRSYSDASRSPSPRRGRDARRSRSSSRSSEERSRSRESDRRRSESREEKRREKKAKKDKRSRRSESASSESSRSSSSEREEDMSPRKRKESDRAVSPDSSTALRLSPPPMAPKLIEVPTAASTADPDEKSAPLRITIANKAAVPVGNTSFKMELDTDEPPRKITRNSPIPQKKIDDDEMVVEEEEEKGGRKTVGGEIAVPPSDALPSTPAAAVQLLLPTAINTNTDHEQLSKGVETRSVETPILTAPRRPATISSLAPSSSGKEGGFALKCPEMAKTVKEMKHIQDQLISTVKHNEFRLSSDLSSGESALDKMEEREALVNQLSPQQKNKFDIKMRQLVNSYKSDASTITTVINSIVQKDPSLEEQIKPALLSVLEDLEKQLYKKADDFLICGL